MGKQNGVGHLEQERIQEQLLAELAPPREEPADGLLPVAEEPTASGVLLLELGLERPGERIHDLRGNQLAHDGRSVPAKRCRHIYRFVVSAEARNGCAHGGSPLAGGCRTLRRFTQSRGS